MFFVNEYQHVDNVHAIVKVITGFHDNQDEKNDDHDHDHYVDHDVDQYVDDDDHPSVTDDQVLP